MTAANSFHSSNLISNWQYLQNRFLSLLPSKFLSPEQNFSVTEMFITAFIHLQYEQKLSKDKEKQM